MIERINITPFAEIIEDSPENYHRDEWHNTFIKYLRAFQGLHINENINVIKIDDCFDAWIHLIKEEKYGAFVCSVYNNKTNECPYFEIINLNDEFCEPQSDLLPWSWDF